LVHSVENSWLMRSRGGVEEATGGYVYLGGKSARNGKRGGGVIIKEKFGRG